jgi:hypothetical protein
VRLLFLTLGLVLLVGGCGSEHTAGPKGTGSLVVARAPALTRAAGVARVAGNGTGVETAGTLDLRTGVARMTTRGHRAVAPFLSDPALALDVVPGAVRVVSYGGVEVQGTGTIKYELDVDPAKALAAAPTVRRARLRAALPAKQFYADVFIDTQGRIRRILLPADLDVPRQYGKSEITNEEMTVDFFEFSAT